MEHICDKLSAKCNGTSVRFDQKGGNIFFNVSQFKGTCNNCGKVDHKSRVCAEKCDTKYCQY